MPLRFGSEIELHVGMWLKATAVNRFPWGAEEEPLPSSPPSAIAPCFLSPLSFWWSAPLHVSILHVVEPISGTREIKDNPHPPTARCTVRLSRSDTKGTHSGKVLIIACIAHPKTWRGYFSLHMDQLSIGTISQNLANLHLVITCCVPDVASAVIQPRFSCVTVLTAFPPIWHVFLVKLKSRSCICLSCVIARKRVIFASDSHPLLVHQIQKLFEILAFGLNSIGDCGKVVLLVI